jgi:hypothetical protein
MGNVGEIISPIGKYVRVQNFVASFIFASSGGYRPEKIFVFICYAHIFKIIIFAKKWDTPSLIYQNR